MHQCLLSLGELLEFPAPLNVVYFSAPKYSERVLTCLNWPKNKFSIKFFLLRFKSSILESVVADPRKINNPLFQFRGYAKSDVDQKRIDIFEYSVGDTFKNWREAAPSSSSLLFWLVLALSKREPNHQSQIG
jgi:hypothetical protein